MGKTSKKGETVEVDGVTFTPDMVVGAPRKGLKVTYTTDTRPVPVIAEAEKGRTFICEGMYGEPDKEAKAREHKHMTFKEAAKIAKRGTTLRKCGLHISALH